MFVVKIMSITANINDFLINFHVFVLFSFCTFYFKIVFVLVVNRCKMFLIDALYPVHGSAINFKLISEPIIKILDLLYLKGPTNTFPENHNLLTKLDDKIN